MGLIDYMVYIYQHYTTYALGWFNSVDYKTLKDVFCGIFVMASITAGIETVAWIILYFFGDDIYKPFYLIGGLFYIIISEILYLAISYIIMSLVGPSVGIIMVAVFYIILYI